MIWSCQDKVWLKVTPKYFALVTWCSVWLCVYKFYNFFILKYARQKGTYSPSNFDHILKFEILHLFLWTWYEISLFITYIEIHGEFNDIFWIVIACTEMEQRYRLLIKYLYFLATCPFLSDHYTKQRVTVYNIYHVTLHSCSLLFSTLSMHIC